MHNSGDISRQVELVREALIEENKKAEQRLGEEKLRAAQFQQDGEKLQIQLSSAGSVVDGLRNELERQRAEAAESRSAAQKTEEKLAAYIAQREQGAARQKFVATWAGILAGALAALLLTLLRFGAVLQTLGMGLAALGLVWLWCADHAGRRLPAAKEWPPLVAFGRFRAWVYGTLLAGALASGAWDGAKSLWSVSPQSPPSNTVQTKPQK